MSLIRAMVFASVNAGLVGAYGMAMVGRVEPLKHEPVRWVILPLMVTTGVVSVLLFPLLRRRREVVISIALLYVGFVLISAVYGAYLGMSFPDGGPWSVLLGLVGGHLYGWPVFLMVLLAYLFLRRWIIGLPIDSGSRPGT